MRISDKDLASSVVSTDSTIDHENVERNFGESNGRLCFCYTLFGQHDYLSAEDIPVVGDEKENGDAEEREHSYAKHVVRLYADGSKKDHYYIKRASNGRFLDPMGNDERKFGKNRARTGMKEYQFREVSPVAFKHYVSFLKTKNHAHFRNAERVTF